MELTEKQRTELWMGHEKGAAAKLPVLWVGDATTSPKWAQDRIIQIRQAIVERRSAPAPSAEYRAAAETRSALVRGAVNLAKKIFTVGRPVVDTLEARAKRNGLTVAQLESADLRLKAKEQSEAIRRDRAYVTALEIRKAKHRVAHNLREDENYCSKCGCALEDVE